ncbi:YfiR family protein [Roseateles oligotrophus]|uniref:YfiR family protein n=1 Tax=Roseateles oligotrophus TaxID=1769250 RepID=A0ABT2YKB3_9BURK|nr:YfiR family protein [Roseateles oligotrophus]MCV2370500.1 YfiR family protein [Roseateles oligotrophus]
MLASARLSAGIGEDQLKAAYLLSFLAYVEWPQGRFPAEGAPIVLATLAQDGVLQSLQEGARGRTVQGRAVDVRLLGRAADALSAHLLYVPAGIVIDAEVMRLLRAAAVLVVGESESFLQAGGAIRLVVVDARLRFDVNLQNVDLAGLRLSARMLQLARLVQRPT